MAPSDTTATIKDLQGDLKQLRDNVGELARKMTTLLSGNGDEAVGPDKGRVHRMRETLDEAVIDASKRGGEALAKVSENCRETIKETLHGYPVTTVALAIGLGFLFGAVWRR